MRKFFVSPRFVNILLAITILVGMSGFQAPTSGLGSDASAAANNADAAAGYTPFSALFELPEEQSTPWVVKAYFSERQMVDELASWADIWEVNHAEGYLVAAVSADEIALLEQAGFVVEIDHELSEQLNTPNLPLPGQISGIPGYPCYRTVEETYASAEQIAADYPQLASWIQIGASWEKIFGILPGYDMMVLRLTNSEIDIPKPKLFIMASVHAREYTPAELATRYAELLVENYNLDADITWLLDYHEIHLLLQANPDGRKHAEGGLPWRKNTNNNFCSNTDNRGVDLNRNYPYLWGCCGGSSGYECAETFRGPMGNSEPETYAVNNYLVEIFPDQRGDDPNDPAPVDATGVFLDLHSYSQLVLWPWGWTETPAPNGTALQTLGRKFAYFNNYAPKQSYDLYKTDGTTTDTAYGHLGLAAYTFEMGTQFFQSCTHFENTIIPGNMPALIYAAKVARTPYMTPSGPDALDLNLSKPVLQLGDPVSLTAVLDDTRFNNSQGSEPTQNIAAGEVYINIPPWLEDQNPQPLPMEPLDGQFNNPVETATVTLDTSELEAGQHILFVRGQDAAGNWGAFSAIFLEIREFGLEHDKTASHTEVFAGQVVSYSLTQNLINAHDLDVTQAITDVLPAELIIMTETIQVNGEPKPDIYDEVEHQIAYDWSGVPETNENSITITYQAQADPEIAEFVEIYNTLFSDATAGGNILSSPDPSLYNLSVLPSPLLTHMKTASESEEIPGEIIDFTLTQELSLPAEFTVTHTLTDTLPAELIVLEDTIYLNGQPAPELYDPDQHSISFDRTEMYAGITELTITYQVQIDPAITEPLEIENTLQSQAQIGDYILESPDPAVFNLSVLETPQLTHAKEANLSEAAPGEIVTYSLTQELQLPKEYLVNLSLVDALPPELQVDTGSIQLNGESRPDLYDEVNHQIVYTWGGVPADNESFITITYLAQIDLEISEPVEIVNTLQSQASVAAVELIAPEPVEVSVMVTPVIRHIYIPISVRN